MSSDHIKPYETYVSGDYLVNNPTWDEEDSAWKAKQVLKIISRNSIQPKSIVDVGCGAGGVLASLHEAIPSANYFGYEIAPDAQSFWGKHANKNISFSICDFLQLKENTKYDTLLLLDVIEHVPNPFAFLNDLHGRAAYYVLHIPLDLSAISVLREKPLLHVRKKVGHIHYFTKGLAMSLILESGYDILDWFYTGAPFTAPKSSWSAKLAKIPRLLVNSVNRDWGVRLFGGDTLMVLAKVRD
jgi:SAM-dependent methyltransferase